MYNPSQTDAMFTCDDGSKKKKTMEKVEEENGESRRMKVRLEQHGRKEEDRKGAEGLQLGMTEKTAFILYL